MDRDASFYLPFPRHAIKISEPLGENPHGKLYCGALRASIFALRGRGALVVLSPAMNATIPLPLLRNYIGGVILGWTFNGKWWLMPDATPVIRWDPVSSLAALAPAVEKLNSLGYQFMGESPNSFEKVCSFFQCSHSEITGWKKDRIASVVAQTEAEALAAAIYHAYKHYLGEFNG